MDSRVPESLITQVYLGDIFTHRNIAKYVTSLLYVVRLLLTASCSEFSQVHPDDVNAVSVLFYVVDHVEVEHVVVVGHSRCGGVIAALEAKEHPPEPPIDQWLKPLIELAEKYPKLEDLVEANIRAQVQNVLQLLQGHELKRPVTVHGWLYHLEDGHLHVLEEHEVRPRHLSSYKL